MNMLVTGGGGQLGRELTALGKARGADVTGVDLPEMDLTDTAQIRAALQNYRPAIVVNTAAFTGVDAAEKEADLAHAVNAAAPGLLAEECRRSNSILIHISTDYVFNGRHRRPYLEDDPVDPLGVYGRTKAEGETLVRRHLDRHVILRTAWLYSAHGKNFVKTIIRLSKGKQPLRVVGDQYGSPTSAFDLAGAILAVAAKLSSGAQPLWGTYHYCGKGIVSWHEFAREIIDQLPWKASLEMITTDEFPTAAARPPYSALDCSRIENAFGLRRRDWRESLKSVLAQLLAEEA